jgi:tRNA (mo5U34)-methyltransferase
MSDGPDVLSASSIYGFLHQRAGQDSWLNAVCELARQKLSGHAHGDLPRWRRALERLPEGAASANLSGSVPSLGPVARDHRALREALMELHPWRKGPLCLGGVRIETEWRSGWKWDRVRPHIDLTGNRVLDIGCGNGYFGLRMLEAGASLVVGIDPTLLFVMQWLACRHFSGDIPNYVLPLGIEDLPDQPATFDTVFTMGVLYHRKDPVHHLKRIRSLLRTGGTMVLETLVLPPGSEQDLLIPQDRYARMRNVWAIPGTGRLEAWVSEAGFDEYRLVNLTKTRVEEQRSTDWMRFESLNKSLDPLDVSKTVEGHPAPVRAVMVAHNK